MNAKLFKKIIAVILAFTVVLVPTLAVSAAEPVQPVAAAAERAPYILVRGFMSADIYADKTDPSSDIVWPPAKKAIIPAVFKVLPSLIGVLITKNYTGFCDKAFPIINDLLTTACLDNSGKPSNGSGVIRDYPTAEEIAKGEILEFKYDWRLDPTDIAAELDKFVNYVCETSGSEKVCVECRSFGGLVTLTYAGLYGTDKIQSVVFNASALFGAGFSGELFNGRMTFDGKALTEFLRAAFAFNDKKDFLNGLFAVLYKIGLTDKICNFLNGLVEKEGERLLRDCLFPLFGRWPSPWAMVSKKNVESSYDFIFGTVFPADSTEYAGLMAAIKNFDEKIRQNREKILNDINENCNLYIISKHGYCSMFLTPEWNKVGDMVIECENSSLGAVVAPCGEKLSDSQLAGKDSAFVSPDRNIDASTCMFPEQTWFIKDITHSKMVDSTLEFVEALLYHDGQATVDTLDGYTRFMVLDDNLVLKPAT